MSIAGPAIPQMSGQTTRASDIWQSVWRRAATSRCRSTSMPNTFGFGEPTPGERLHQIVDKHLRALATASAGGENEFGLDIEGKADMRRLALMGHSRRRRHGAHVQQQPQNGHGGSGA